MQFISYYDYHLFLVYFLVSKYYKVVLTCTVNDDCKSGEGFQVRWIAHNHAEIRIPQNFKLHGTFKCVTKEVNNGSTCSWPPLSKTDLLFRLLIFMSSV